MLIPLTTDRPQRHFPLTTWVVMLLNIALFVAMEGLKPTNPEGFKKVNDALTLDPVAMGLNKGAIWLRQDPDGGYRQGKPGPGAIETFRVTANSGGWWTLLSYQFVHGGFMHILGNLLVLWVFGPSVEDRFGRIGFALFYLVGGVLAGLMHGVFDGSPVIGASGSIAAVTGAFLVLFPRTHVKMFVFFLYVGVFELPAWVFIAFAMAKDVWGVGTNGEGVAFLAHIGGYLFGFSLAMALLMSKVLPEEDWSLFAIARHAKRRAEFKASAREAELEWKKRIEKPSASGRDKTDAARPAETQRSSERGAGYGTRVKHPVPGGVEERVLWQRVEASEAQSLSDAESERAASLRLDLAKKVAADDAAGASLAFRTLVKEGRPTEGNRRVLVEAGNLFAAAGKHHDAADAYEAFLASLKSVNDPEEGRVRLMLALVCQRYLKNPTRAGAALAGIKGSFREPELHELAASLREELKTVAGR